MNSPADKHDRQGQNHSGHDRFEQLTAAILSGAATTAERTELDALLLAHAPLRSEYLELCRLHAALRFATKTTRAGSTTLDAVDAAVREEVEESKAESGRMKNEANQVHPSSRATHQTTASRLDPRKLGGGSLLLHPSSTPFTPRRRSAADLFVSRHNFGIAVCVTLVLALVVVGWSARTYISKLADISNVAERDEVEQPETKQPEFVAFLNHDHGAVWVEGKPKFAHRPAMKPGHKLEIASGLIEVKYYTGARVVIEGPAVFYVGRMKEATEPAELARGEGEGGSFHPSKNSGYLARGSLVARCTTPESKGFTVHTPNAQVVDLSTEFGVNVSEGGASQVAVLDGAIQFVSAAGTAFETKVILVKGQGAMIAAGSREIERRDSAEVRLVAAMRDRLEKMRVVAQPATADSRSVELLTNQTTVDGERDERPRLVATRKQYIRHIRHANDITPENTFVWTGAGDAQSWEDAANWTDGNGQAIAAPAYRPAMKTQQFFFQGSQGTVLTLPKNYNGKGGGAFAWVRSGMVQKTSTEAGGRWDNNFGLRVGGDGKPAKLAVATSHSMYGGSLSVDSGGTLVVGTNFGIARHDADIRIVGGTMQVGGALITQKHRTKILLGRGGSITFGSYGEFKDLAGAKASGVFVALAGDTLQYAGLGRHGFTVTAQANNHD